MIVTKTIQLKTNANTEIVDVTREVQDVLAASNLSAGIVTVFVPHSTAGVTTIETESGLIVDFRRFWDRIVPAGYKYEHDAGYGEGNGHSHVRASLLGPSVTIPFAGGKMTLGTWQQIVVVDFDSRPRTRDLVVQVMGE